MSEDEAGYRTPPVVEDVAADEAVGESVGDASPTRLLALTDGIFAISMTLLALDAKLPEGLQETAAGFAEGRHELYGRFGVFFVAFLITSRFWIVSHRQLGRLKRVDATVLQRAVLFLFGICAIPVATSVLVRYGNVAEAVAFGAPVLGGTTLLSTWLWWYVSDPRHDLSDVPQHQREEEALRGVLVTAAYLVAVPVAYALPENKAGAAPLIWLFMAVVDPVAHRLHRRVEKFRARRA